GFQFITGIDGLGNPDPAKTVGIAPNSGIITFVPGQSFPGTWRLGGNGGTACTTSPCANFIGTTDNTSFELRVNASRAYRVEPATSNALGSPSFAPNNIAGFSGNSVTAGAGGTTIAGGGASGNLNVVTDDFGTVGGGAGNRAGDNSGTTSDSGWD